jgi:integrase
MKTLPMIRDGHRKSYTTSWDLDPAAVICTVTAFTLTFDSGVRGHRQGYNYVNLMRLFFLCNAPTARRLQRDRAANREPYGSIGVSNEILTFHPELRDALSDLRRQTEATGPVLRSQRSGPMTPVSIVNWFANAYRAIGLQGCSSHSGRRTFITRAARLVHHAGASLRDVQLMAGHRSIQTTQRYIDGDTDAQRKLVSLI